MRVVFQSRLVAVHRVGLAARVNSNLSGAQLIEAGPGKLDFQSLLPGLTGQQQLRRFEGDGFAGFPLGIAKRKRAKTTAVPKFAVVCFNLNDGGVRSVQRRVHQQFPPGLSKAKISADAAIRVLYPLSWNRCVAQVVVLRVKSAGQLAKTRSHNQHDHRELQENC